MARPKKPLKYLETGLKFCPLCKLQLSLDSFTKGKHYHGGFASYCKSCRAKKEKNRRKNPEVKAQIKKYKSQRRDKTKHDTLLWKFGITLNDYNSILKSQDYVCAICSKANADKIKRNLVVDHCHKTGTIRGLLCTNCNLGIGNLKDNVESLKKAIIYLEKFNERFNNDDTL